MPRACLAMLMAARLPAASLAETIEKLIAGNPASRTAYWGIEVVDLASGRTLFEQNHDHFFVPASNTKLFTTALALARLGPEYTFQTRVLADSEPDAEGRVRGALRLIGGGDPNLSARTIPYKMGSATGDPLIAIESLADQIMGRGVKRVDGGLIGDDTWYEWEPFAPGWSIDDPKSDDGPAISALTVNDNTISVHVRAGAGVGEPASLSLTPAVEYYRIDNRVRTVAAGGERRIRFERLPGSREARLSGTIPLRDRGQDLLLGIDDPSLFAAEALREALEERGITVAGGVSARHQLPDEPPVPAAGGVELAVRNSAPLIEDLRITDKVSQNLHAEMALRAVARVRKNSGSFEAAREERKAFLSEMGIDGGSYTLIDGSGLSRLNLITPGAMIKLLRYMYDSPWKDAWISLLPVGGQDGTLASRFADAAVLGKVHAKTGSLSHVSALSGYLERADGKWLAFSILVNNYNGPTAEVRGVMDRICAALVE